MALFLNVYRGKPKAGDLGLLTLHDTRLPGFDGPITLGCPIGLEQSIDCASRKRGYFEVVGFPILPA